MVQKLCLLDQIHDRIHLRHYNIRTEQAYLGWIRRFVLFHKKRPPRDMVIGSQSFSVGTDDYMEVYGSYQQETL